MPLQDLPSVLESGEADASVISYEAEVKYKRAHPDAIRLTTASDLPGAGSYTLVADAALDDPGKAAAVYDYLERRIAAQKWITDNPDIWLEEFYVKERKQTPEDAAVVVEGTGDHHVRADHPGAAGRPPGPRRPALRGRRPRRRGRRVDHLRPRLDRAQQRRARYRAPRPAPTGGHRVTTDTSTARPSSGPPVPADRAATGADPGARPDGGNGAAGPAATAGRGPPARSPRPARSAGAGARRASRGRCAASGGRCCCWPLWQLLCATGVLSDRVMAPPTDVFCRPRVDLIPPASCSTTCSRRCGGWSGPVDRRHRRRAAGRRRGPVPPRRGPARLDHAGAPGDPGARPHPAGHHLVRHRRAAQDPADRHRHRLPRVHQHLRGHPWRRRQAGRGGHHLRPRPAGPGAPGDPARGGARLPGGAAVRADGRLADHDRRRADQRQQRPRLPDQRGPQLVPHRHHRDGRSWSTACSAWWPTGSSGSSSARCWPGAAASRARDRRGRPPPPPACGARPDAPPSTAERRRRRGPAPGRSTDAPSSRGIDLNIAPGRVRGAARAAAGRARRRCCASWRARLRRRRRGAGPRPAHDRVPGATAAAVDAGAAPT